MTILYFNLADPGSRAV